MIWKDPNKEEPIQSVPLLIILKQADLTWADGGAYIGYTDDHGFQTSMGWCEKEDVHCWCYVREILDLAPLPEINKD